MANTIAPIAVKSAGTKRRRNSLEFAQPPGKQTGFALHDHRLPLSPRLPAQAVGYSLRELRAYDSRGATCQMENIHVSVSCSKVSAHAALPADIRPFVALNSV
jgi:hypothetical protein